MFCFVKNKIKTFNPIMIECKGAGKVESYGSERRRRIDDNQAMRCPEGIEYKVTKDYKIHPNIFTYTVGGAKTGHPAVFPNQLANDMIKSFTNERNIVFDPFAGSGTTLVEAKRLNRRFIGFDIVSKYCDITKERLKNV